MKKIIIGLIAIGMLDLLCASCGGQAKSGERPMQQQQEKTAVLGSFNADSAYAFVAKQVEFGPRVPGTVAHKQCGDYIIDKLNTYGADTVMEQTTTVKAFNGDMLPIRNIFARFNPTASSRVLLVAHYDTRPWANMESSEEKRNKPIPGANDGGSGVGVLLEIARNLALKSTDCGVDFLFTDAEDYGSNSSFNSNDMTWCLGSQYWAEHLPYTTVDRPNYGILLDMVGGRNARFHREMLSHKAAKVPTVKVWGEANALGFGDIFINKVGGAVMDDHIPLIKAGIPTTDIIENMSNDTGDFPANWHTLDDDMQHISRGTLNAVGTTVLNVLYKEKAQ